MIYIGTPARILAAAQDALIAGDGQMEMAAVARHAKVSVGLAYHHFGSKTGLLVAVVDSFYEALADITLGEAISRALPWAVRERARTDAMVDHFFTHPLAKLIAGRLARTPEVLDIEQHHGDQLLSEGAKNIEQGQKLGLIPNHLDPKTTVAMLMGGVRLAIDQAILREDPPSPDDLKDQLWSLICGTIHLAPTARTESKITGAEHVG